MNKTINKSMNLEDLNDTDAKNFINKLIELDEYFNKNKCSISSWYGEINANDYYKKLSKLNRGYNYKPILSEKLDEKYPSFLLWEIYWVIKNLNMKKNTTLLDIGGACSLFSFYVASLGIKVIAIDINKKLVDDANIFARKLKLNYKAICLDAEEYIKNEKDKFDYITSICVFEHIEIEKRKRIIKRLHKFLNEKGKIAFTFDYKNPSKFTKINTLNDINEQFLCSKKLKLMENTEFYDNNINYLIHPFYRKPIFWKYKIKSIKKGNFDLKDILKTKQSNDYSFGAIFLEKID